MARLLELFLILITVRCTTALSTDHDYAKSIVPPTKALRSQPDLVLFYERLDAPRQALVLAHCGHLAKQESRVLHSSGHLVASKLNAIYSVEEKERLDSICGLVKEKEKASEDTDNSNDSEDDEDAIAISVGLSYWSALGLALLMSLCCVCCVAVGYGKTCCPITVQAKGKMYVFGCCKEMVVLDLDIDDDTIEDKFGNTYKRVSNLQAVRQNEDCSEEEEDFNRD